MSSAWNDAASTTSDQDDRMLTLPSAYEPRIPLRVNLFGRLAIRLDIALIRWSPLPLRIESREELVRRNELDKAHREHAAANQTWVLLHLLRL